MTLMQRMSESGRCFTTGKTSQNARSACTNSRLRQMSLIYGQGSNGAKLLFFTSSAKESEAETLHGLSG